MNTLSPHPRLVVRWFIQYNPMFTASALCVLGGVLLSSCAMGSRAVLALSGVLELYQWLVIGVAALLYRRLLERRPAAILGVIALGFLIDPTLQLSGLAAAHDLIASIAWIVLFAAKWRALAWAFRLRLNKTAQIVPPVAAALVAALPNARVYDVAADALPALVAVAVFVLGVVVVFARPRVESKSALGEVGAVMFPRLVRAAAVILGAGVVYQYANAMFAAGPAPLFAIFGAASCVLAVGTKREPHAFGFAGAGALCCALGDAEHGGVGLGLALAAAALLLASRDKAPRVFNAGVACALAAVVVPAFHLGAPLFTSPPVVAAGLVATALFAFSLAKRRAWSSIPLLAVIYARPLLFAADAFGPRGDGQWGAVLLAFGFVLVPAGVVVHRRLSRALAASDAALDEAATADAPSSPAAISTRAAAVASLRGLVVKASP